VRSTFNAVLFYCSVFSLYSRKITIFMPPPLVGIIANPASGRDIRRLVAHGTVFDNNEKAAIVRRILLGLDAIGIQRVAYMPEHDFGIVPRALAELQEPPLHLVVEPLEMPVLGTSADSTYAAQLLARQGAGCIITLGGDGTNRAVATGSATVPLLPISTGTNNVFPTFLEGTIAGMAAGLVAHGLQHEQIIQQAPRLEVRVDGHIAGSALVDVVASSLPFIGSRALWDTAVVREVALASVTPATIGFSALGGALLKASTTQSKQHGMHIILDEHGEQVLVPLAPGLVRWVGVKAHRPIQPGQYVTFQPGSGTVALDGEREIELSTSSTVEVYLCPDGPFVINVAAALTAAAHVGRLHRPIQHEAE
jgi:predicted polyphosphate/ATP-dependent NAD kinase